MHDDMFHGARVITQGGVDDPLERDVLALAIGQVGGNHDLRPTRPDPVAKGARPEPGEHHDVDRPDAQDGEHRRDRLDRRRHVDRDAVAPTNAERPQGGRNPADLGEQLGVGQGASATALVRRDQGDLVREPGLDLVVERGPGHVGAPTGEPAEGRWFVLEDPVGSAKPGNVLVGDGAPERFRVGARGRPKFVKRMRRPHRSIVRGHQGAQAPGRRPDDRGTSGVRYTREP